MPLFEQFRTELFTPRSGANGLAIDAFEGHTLEAFQLRGRATKLVYTRLDDVTRSETRASPRG